MGALAQYVSNPKSPVGQVTVANPNRDGTGTLVTLFTAGQTAGSVGSRIDDIAIKAAVPTTAGMVRFFHYDGTNTRLLKEINVSAITPSATVQAFESLLYNLGWCFQPTHELRVSTEKAEAINIHITRGGDI